MSIDIPRGFRGLRWEPTDEQDVVVLFGRLLDYLPRPLAVENVRTGFPDCKATDSETGDEICIEFELKASHFFRDHSGRSEKCDWVVCWNDDLETKPPKSPRVVALDAIVDRVMPTLILNRLSATESQLGAFRLRLAGLSVPQQQVIERLLEFGGTEGLRTDWPETNGACFTVRGPVAEFSDIEYFKVSSTGRLGVPFYRWGRVPKTVKTDVAARLNKAICSESFSGTGKTGRDISEILCADTSLEKFIRVWQELGRQHRP